MSLIVSCNIQIDHHVVYGGERGSIKVANEVAVVGHSEYLPVFFLKIVYTCTYLVFRCLCKKESAFIVVKISPKSLKAGTDRDIPSQSFGTV